MYEITETQIADLPDDLKQHVSLNIPEREAVLHCYKAHRTGFLLEGWGVIVLTDRRLDLPAPEIGDQLMKLAELRKNGFLTADEFEAAKRKLLS